MGKDILKQILKCTSTLSTILTQPKTYSLLFALSNLNKICLTADTDTSNKRSDDIRELIEAIIKDNENLGLDEVYDGSIAIKYIIEYIKHLVRDAHLNLMLLTKLIMVPPFGCTIFVKKSSLSNIAKARGNILVKKAWLYILMNSFTR